MAVPDPSTLELRLLKILWARSPLSARELHNALPAELDWTISTTRTMLERMREKGLLKRRSVHGIAVYEASQAKVAVVGSAIRHALRDLLEIDGPVPAAAFSGSRLLSLDELETLAALINGASE